MWRMISGLVIVATLGAPQSFAQELPPRCQALTRNEHFRLVRVIGTPEMQVSYMQVAGFSNDGKHAVYAEDLSTGADDKVIHRARLSVWSQGKNWPREIELSGRNVTALALSPDGKQVLLAGLMPGIGIFKPGGGKKKGEPHAYLGLMELDTGKNVYLAPTPESLIHAVALAPDGFTCLAATAQGVKRWDLKSGKEIGIYHDSSTPLPATLTYLADGREFLAGYQSTLIPGQGKDKKPSFAGVRRWDVAKPKKPITSYGNGDVWHLAVARDGKRFASGELGFGITLWETDSGKEINSYKIEKDSSEDIITAVGIADDSKTVLATLAKDAGPEDRSPTKLFAWDGVANKTLWTQSTTYRGRLPILVQKESLLIGGGPNLLESWNIKSGKLTNSLGGHKGSVSGVAATSSGDVVSAGQEGVLMTWRKGVLAERESAHKGAITAMALSKDRSQWLTAGADLEIRSWPPDAARTAVFRKKHAGPITSLAYSEKGNWAVSGSADRSVRTWFVPTGAEIATFQGHAEGVNAVAISPDEKWIASASDDATIRLWPIKDGKPDPDRDVAVLEKHTKPVTCLAFSPDGKRLVSGSQDHKLMSWDWQKGAFDFMIVGHKNWVTSLSFLDTKTVITTSDDLSVCMWDLSTGNEIGRIDFGLVGDSPRCLALAGPDRLLVGTSGWLIYEFEIVKSKARP